MVSALINEKAANDLSLIPLSNDTVKKRIDGLSSNIKEQLLERVRMCPYFALQLNESTDITKKRPYCAMLDMSTREIFSKTFFSSPRWYILQLKKYLTA